MKQLTNGSSQEIIIGGRYLDACKMPTKGIWHFVSVLTHDE